MALDGSGYLSNSYNSMLPISCIMRLDSSRNFKEFSGFPRSSRIDFVREPFLNCSTATWIFPIRSSSFKITSCAIPQVLRSTLNSGSFSTSDSALRFSFLTQRSSGFTLGLPCSSLCTSFLVLEDTLSEVSCCCCCCCDCHALSQVQSSLRCGESLKQSSLPFLRNHNLPAQSCMQLRHETLSAKIVILLSCARVKLIQQTAS